MKILKKGLEVIKVFFIVGWLGFFLANPTLPIGEENRNIFLFLSIGTLWAICSSSDVE